MTTTSTFGAAVLALALVASSAAAQQRTTIDLRATTVTTITDFADADLSAGLGFGGTVAIRLQPHLHVYGGWDWLRFTSDASFAGADRDFEETGYTFGLRFEHPMRAASRTSYRLEAGGLYKHVEIENSNGDLVSNSGHGLGFELGAGLLLPLGDSWRLAPTARLRSHSPSFTIGSVTTDATMRYIGLELGLSRRF
jgi:opacity protein-like surface antigen